jgi:hypothetical protein
MTAFYFNDGQSPEIGGKIIYKDLGFRETDYLRFSRLFPVPSFARKPTWVPPKINFDF